ncbi:vacuolar protein sorting-associated protein 72 homolog [Mizuhopecten yessoensis]|uniref:Vacuolar protein sorting-associated protein 72 homolog n=1 Tax=Mizuhopecten yessoensis TaxID=6573 RepID=A0A210PIJ9_MIZYE|nr:vacuolar protein sorting-associated protein 72 homolog [Mizuhopecten yessoensis]XP_021340757.1 vacuolar protein sorting-associated protein 72 homolog [Mizuhopecten yessoensis]OWF36321.1 Vacuolar protein sorting-associated protein 72-like [Mizuhopecten yessoensis]
MAATRERRATAGNKMGRMLDAEEEDDFYKTTYGGFNEEEDDKVYNSEDSESDQIDSDFSIDENDEVRSDADDDDAPKKRKGVSTKAYKEPVKKLKTEDRKPKEKKEKEKKKKTTSSVQIYHAPIEKKSLRRSTAVKSNAREEREKVREMKQKMLKDMALQKKVAEVRRLTQEELLAEAEITEELNLQSLENYHRMEMEKKKSRVTKQINRGPLIRYQSFTMPLIEELPCDVEISVDVDSIEPQKKVEEYDLVNCEKCSRTFVTFTDERIFKDYFPQKKHKPPVKQYCPVTKKPAKYFDPITQTPYSSLKAFHCIREAYSQQQEETGHKKK